jgi:hypothetical protein
MSDMNRRYSLSGPLGFVLGVGPVVYMFISSWKVGLVWLVVFLLALRED